jgi:hypothetical protein
MNWLNAINKNNEEFKNYVEKKDVVINDKKINIIDLNIKDYDEEFEMLYSNKIIELKSEFNELIKHECLPFLNNRISLNKIHNINNSFFDFIKYNSINYDNIIKSVEKENNEYINQNEFSDDENLNNDIYDVVD